MKLFDIFSSDMVFAAGKPIRIFGEGVGKAVITFDGVSKSIISDTSFWSVEFEPKEYGGPYELYFETEDISVTLSNIYVGEVYLFAGQSNMELMLSQTNTDKLLYEDNDRLRYISISDYPNKLAWQSATNENVASWSALGYLASRKIAAEKNIHIGIIVCAVGASVIESWLPRGALEKIGIALAPSEKHFDHQEYIEWNSDGTLYERKIKRIIPFSISGVVWYQGESDTSEAEGEVYERELCELIKLWREAFIQKNLPFCVVQISDFKSRLLLDNGWKMIQNAQKNISKYLPYTYTVESKDVCENDMIHPVSKTVLANRISDVIRKFNS